MALLAILLSVLAHGTFLWVVQRPGWQPPPPASPVHPPLSLHLQAAAQRAPALPTAPESARPAPALPDAASSAAPSFPESQYLAFGALSGKPRFLRFLHDVPPVHLPDPEIVPVDVRVYLNENGTPDRVELEDNPLSAQARQWIADQLRAMQFSPGMLAGQPVKSLLQFQFSVEATPAYMPLSH